VPHATCASAFGTQHVQEVAWHSVPPSSWFLAPRFRWMSSRWCSVAQPQAYKGGCAHKGSCTFSKLSPHTPRRFTTILASFINPTAHPFSLPRAATVTCIRISVSPWKACLATLMLSPPQHLGRALGQLSMERYATLAAARFPRIDSHRCSGISRSSLSADTP
jgi:hypothetical protein